MPNRFFTVAALTVGGILISKYLMKNRSSDSNSTVEESIEVDMPVSSAYKQWVRFEDFPKFMDSVHEVRQLDDRHLHWRADVAGKEREWDAEITEQIPYMRVAWRGTGTKGRAGVVTFHKLSDETTKVILQMDYDPQNFSEQLGDTLATARMQAQGSLKNFKKLLESGENETGAWRGGVIQH